ncbi:hypothetical protein V7S43_001659 [Phytophthora oleae]|uniref:Uncharacterized protein n=1 Tax=Phytophthora oleae TaxID=2107226 RepID=A0ABD3G837_9STRA
MALWWKATIHSKQEKVLVDAHPYRKNSNRSLDSSLESRRPCCRPRASSAEAVCVGLCACCCSYCVCFWLYDVIYVLVAGRVLLCVQLCWARRSLTCCALHPPVLCFLLLCMLLRGVLL